MIQTGFETERTVHSKYLIYPLSISARLSIDSMVQNEE